MTQTEQKTINEVQVVQATMKEHQRNMQNDIDELKKVGKEMNEKLDKLTSTLDSLMGSKKVLIWLTGVALSITGMAIALFNHFDRR